MTAPLDHAAAFAAGLLGSAHCVGMCGSLACAFFLRQGSASGPGRGGGPWPLAVYHGARIGVYALAGGLAAALGTALVSTGIVGKAQGILQIAAGLMVVALALELAGWARLPTLGLPVRLLQPAFATALRRGPLAGAAVGGALNGLMPCALTLAMAVKATTAAGPPDGALLMLAFGAGTLPSMLFVSAIPRIFGNRLRGWLLKGAALLVAALGAATVAQGVLFFTVMSKLQNW